MINTPLNLGDLKLSNMASFSMRPKSATLEAVVTRADGTVENLGVIARTDFSLLGRIKSLIFRKAKS